MTSPTKPPWTPRSQMGRSRALLPKRLRAWLALALLVIAAGGVGVWIAWMHWFARGPEPDVPPPLAAEPIWFRDATATSGVNFTYLNGEEAHHFSILESLGGGVALLDYDGDGLIDIFVTGGGSFDRPRSDYPEDERAYADAVRKSPPALSGHACKLYRNLGNLCFEDVTRKAGLDLPWFYTHGVAVADYDRDGWPDLVVTGFGKLMLLHNVPDGDGGRRFVDVTEAMGLADGAWSTSAGWADLDGDGWPDLYVCHYVDWSFARHPTCYADIGPRLRDVCPPGQFKPIVHALFHNERGKGFRNVAVEQGFEAKGCGLGVVLVDINDDGQPDIYVANDVSNKFLFVNRKGKLEEKGMSAGVALDDTGHYTGSMGIDAGDFEGTGRPALWVTNYQGDHHGLYKNLGGELFHCQTRPAGIAALGQMWVGFGTAFVDVDNDGWEDLVIVNGHVLRHPPGAGVVLQHPVLLHNTQVQRRRFFQDVTARGGRFFETPALGRGLAIGDLDNDGWPDMVVSSTNSSVAVLRNEAALSVPANWLGVRLVGKGHRDVIGSTVVLEGETDKRTRFAKGGGSYLSARDPRILFGLGPSRHVRRVTVKWSWGLSQSWDWTGRDVNAYWELHEGEPEPRRAGATGS